MNIVKSSAMVYNDNDPETPYSATEGLKQIRKIEYFARISHRSEERMTAISYDKFLRFVVLEKGDWSVVEHGWASVEFYVDRGITHEIVRHRIASFTQESTRFVNYAKKVKPNFIYPGGAKEGEMLEKGLLYDPDWEQAIASCEHAYEKLVGKGWSPQLARSVFPNALGSKIAMTCNLRNWRHFLLMRTTRESHPQMRDVTDVLLEDMQYFFPIIFEDIVPGATQAENLKKMR